MFMLHVMLGIGFKAGFLCPPPHTHTQRETYPVAFNLDAGIRGAVKAAIKQCCISTKGAAFVKTAPLPAALAVGWRVHPEDLDALLYKCTHDATVTQHYMKC